MAIVSKRVNGLIPGKEYLLGVKIKNSSIGLSSDMSDVIRFQVPTDQTIPGTVQNFALYQGIESVMFVFDFTSDDDISTHEYELYDSNNLNTGNKISSGFNDANVFTVSVDNLQEDNEGTGLVPYWGRVRAVDTSGNVGEWTNLVQTDSRTPLIDNQFIGSLTAAKITAGTIGAHEIILTQPGTATTITTPDNKAILRSSDYNGSYNNTTDTWSAGTAGWIISGDGRAEFNNATIRGTLQFIDGSAPGLIYYGATQPSIPSPFTAKLISAISGNGTSVTYTTGTTAHGLSVGKIISLNNVIPSQYNLKNQYVTAVTTYTFTISSSATGTFDPIYSVGAEVVAGQIPEYSIWYNSTSGDNKSYIYSSSTWNQSLANVSNLNPQNQTQTGLIAGTTITGGGITLSAGGNIKGGQTAYDTGTGFFLGYSSSAYRFSIGNSSGNKLTWDGTNLKVTGEINANSGTFSGTITASGTISGGTIDGATITGSTLRTAASGNRVHINTNDITLYYNSSDVSNIYFSGSNVYTSSIYSDGTIRLRGYGSSSEVRVGFKPNNQPGTYIYSYSGLEVVGGLDGTQASSGHLQVKGTTGNEANISLINNNTHVQIRTANNDNTLYIRRANDSAYCNVNGGVYTNGSSIKYKENVQSVNELYNSIIEKIMKLDIVKFNYKGDEKDYFGLIAENTYDVFPEIVTLNEANEPEGIKIMDLLAHLIAAIQEMNK